MGKKDSSLQPGGAAMLVLALLKEREMYGYQIIEELERRSNQVFQLKEGTCTPSSTAWSGTSWSPPGSRRPRPAGSGGTTTSPPPACGPWRRSRSSGPPTPRR